MNEQQPIHYFLLDWLEKDRLKRLAAKEQASTRNKANALKRKYKRNTENEKETGIVNAE